MGELRRRFPDRSHRLARLVWRYHAIRLFEERSKARAFPRRWRKLRTDIPG